MPDEDFRTITKRELVNRIADETGQTKVIVRDVLQRFLDSVIDELASGNRLEFRDFGVFEVRERAARIAQNPRTLEKVNVPPKRVVKFKVGRVMRKRVCEELEDAVGMNGHAPGTNGHAGNGAQHSAGGASANGASENGSGSGGSHANGAGTNGAGPNGAGPNGAGPNGGRGGGSNGHGAAGSEPEAQKPTPPTPPPSKPGSPF